MCHHRPGRHDGAFTDVHAGQDGGGSPNPDIRIESDGFRRDVLTSHARLDGMTSCHEVRLTRWMDRKERRRSRVVVVLGTRERRGGDSRAVVRRD